MTVIWIIKNHEWRKYYVCWEILKTELTKKRISSLLVSKVNAKMWWGTILREAIKVVVAVIRTDYDFFFFQLLIFFLIFCIPLLTFFTCNAFFHVFLLNKSFHFVKVARAVHLNIMQTHLTLALHTNPRSLKRIKKILMCLTGEEQQKVHTSKEWWNILQLHLRSPTRKLPIL